MNRLLQGDVGSGKTAVALLAMLAAMENGYQAALMAPTEILAEQHARNIKRLLAETPYRVELLTGSLKAAEKRRLHEGPRRRRDPRRRRHARAHPGGGRVQQTRPRRHRRAAPLRRPPARGAARARLQPRRAGDDGHAHPALARHDRLRRPRRLRHRRAAARTHAHQDGRRRRGQARGRLQGHRARGARGPSGLRRLPAGRRVGEDGLEGRDAHVRAPARPRLPELHDRAPPRQDEVGREGRGDAPLRRRARYRCSSPRRSSRSAWTCRTPR